MSALKLFYDKKAKESRNFQKNLAGFSAMGHFYITYQKKELKY